MDHPPAPASDADESLMPRAWALIAVVVELALLGVSLAGGAWSEGRAPFPFAWRDVAIVHVACALPLGWLLAASLRRRFSAAGITAAAVLLCGAGLIPCLEPVRASLMAALGSYPFLGAVLRAASAFGVTLSASLLWAVLSVRQDLPSGQDSLRYRAAIFGLGLALLVLAPALYVRARCRHDVSRLGELLEQARLGEAHTLAQALLVLDAGAHCNGQALPEVALKIDRGVREIEASILRPLTLRASDNERLDRARRLAMLGRAESAVEVLQAIRDPALAAEVEYLLGAIYENRNEWEIALASYQRAQAAWDARSPSPARAAGKTRATIGVAFCERKLGRYAEAEASYQKVLAISPTADTHFLLAQFYEDSQQAGKAQTHARLAMTLSPARYQQKGEKLLRRLSVYHFGCLGVFSAENSRSDAPLTSQ